MIKISYTLNEISEIGEKMRELNTSAQRMSLDVQEKLETIQNMLRCDLEEGVPQAYDKVRKQLLKIDNTLEDLYNISIGYNNAVNNQGKAENDNSSKNRANMPVEEPSLDV